MKLARLLRFGAKLPTHKLTGIDLLLTRQCNLACPYCGVVAERDRPTLSAAQWRRIIDYFVRHRHMHLIFTGGEPVLHPALPELVDHAAHHAITCLMSNGKALEPAVLAELPRLDFLVMSLDPALDGVESSGKHAFDKLPWMAEHARRTGLSISLGVTVTRANVAAVPELVRQVQPYRMPVLLSLFHAGGGAYDFRTEREDLDFRSEEDLAALGGLAEELKRMKRAGYLIGETDAYLDALVPFKRGERVTECRAGLDWFEVDCDGRVKACHDGPPIDLNILDEPDYEDLRRRAHVSAPDGCRCVYDFYFNARHFRTRPLSYLWEVWRTRNLLG